MKKIIFNKNLAFPLAIFLLCAVVLVFSLRGNLGNPSENDLNLHYWKEGGPFELSPERGRFALLYSFIENDSLSFSIPLARFSAPDIAVTETGKYVSLFMPGVSFLVIPGYLLGKLLGASQAGTFAVVAFFAFMNFLLIKAIAMRLGASRTPAYFSAFAFLFATPSFAYAVSLYQHHISVFIVLLSIYLLLRWNNFWSLSAVWLLCALSVVVDNPNLFLMIPVGLYGLARIANLEKAKSSWKIKVKPLLVFSFVSMIVPIGFFLWFNQTSYGDPFQLPGTLRSVEAIDENGVATNPSKEAVLVGNVSKSSEEEKTAVGFFKTRNLLNGFYIHFISRDRGILWFAPIVLLGILGIFFLYRKNSSMANLFSSIILTNVLLYSMWGDPWGGWAFGSRYLIPTYAILSIGIGVALSRRKSSVWFLTLLFVLFAYSVGVNTLGALTSSMNPPKVQVLQLEELSGTEQKYTYARNWQYLNQNGLKSFVWQTWAKNHVSARTYYFVISSVIVLSGLTLLIFSARDILPANNKK